MQTDEKSADGKRVGSTDGLGMIAIGRNAQANLPGEFVLNVELDKQQNIYTTFRTILSEPEFTMLSNILRRMIRDAATGAGAPEGE